jgi:hypothetical protein
MEVEILCCKHNEIKLTNGYILFEPRKDYFIISTDGDSKTIHRSEAYAVYRFDNYLTVVQTAVGEIVIHAPTTSSEPIYNFDVAYLFEEFLRP